MEHAIPLQTSSDRAVNGRKLFSPAKGEKQRAAADGCGKTVQNNQKRSAELGRSKVISSADHNPIQRKISTPKPTTAHPHG